MVFSDNLLSILKSSNNVVAVCGAGISQESGVPTFRGKEGLWKKFKPGELANLNSFINNPKLVWEWYNYRKKLVSEVEPNPGHYALAEMENIFDNLFIITQNVDNLHQKAGSKNIVEIHGNMMKNRCLDCNKYYEDIPVNENIPDIPKCSCGGLIRPDVVWFGESIPEKSFMKSYELLRECQLLFVIGTSGNVYPAASFPIIAKNNGAYLVEINIDKTMMSYMMNETLLGPSGEIMPQIVNILKN